MFCLSHSKETVIAQRNVIWSYFDSDRNEASDYVIVSLEIVVLIKSTLCLMILLTTTCAEIQHLLGSTLSPGYTY